MVQKGDDKKSKVPTKYTSKKHTRKVTGDETASLSSETSRSSCGWKDEGLVRFNQFVEMLEAKRPHRKPFEMKYMQDWRDAVKKETTSNKRKRAQKAAGSIIARNTLFADNAPLAVVDPNENPYGPFDTTDVVNRAAM